LIAAARERVFGDHRPDTRIAEQLQQHNVWHAAVQKVGRPHTMAHRVERRRGLGDHPPLEAAIVDHRLKLGCGDPADQARGVIDVG
jgi:hypothetical protein